jgi:hypothetical protein
MASAQPFFFYQTSRLQHLQMLRYGGAAYGKPCRQLADRGRALPQQIENGLASGIRERIEQFSMVSHDLP